MSEDNKERVHRLVGLHTVRLSSVARVSSDLAQEYDTDGEEVPDRFDWDDERWDDDDEEEEEEEEEEEDGEEPQQQAQGREGDGNAEETKN